jgi:hypothetical protein
MRLSVAQRDAVIAGSPAHWYGCRETGVRGDVMSALDRRGLAEVRREHEHDGRCLYRLTPAGNTLRVRWALDHLTEPVDHTPIRVRCTHCAAEFGDGTPGGSCGRCGLTVEVIETPPAPGGVRYVLESVGEQGRYGVRDTQTGELVRFRADGRWRRWSSVERAIEGANALNGRAVYIPTSNSRATGR